MKNASMDKNETRLKAPENDIESRAGPKKNTANIAAATTGPFLFPFF